MNATQLDTFVPVTARVSVVLGIIRTKKGRSALVLLDPNATTTVIASKEPFVPVRKVGRCAGAKHRKVFMPVMTTRFVLVWLKG